jgi:RNA polymerase sigma-70 factor (ECF subfamily)
MEAQAYIAIKDKEQGAVKMDGALLESIYRQYYKNVYNYIAFRINNHHDTEELAALVFEKAMMNWGKYNPNLPVEAWLIAIAKNTVTDHFRGKGRRHFVPLDDVVKLFSDEGQPEEIAVVNEENKALLAAMSKLKDRERQILSMKFATDLGHEEIGGVLGMSPGNVGVIAHRALKKLRRIMEEDGI